MATKETNSRNAETSHTRRAAQTAHETIEQLAEKGELTEERISEIINEAAERLRSTGQQARQRGEHLVDNVYSYVRERPLTAVGVAFAAGFLISALNRRNQ